MTQLRLPYFDLSAEALKGLRSVKSYLENSALNKTLLEWVYLRVSQIKMGAAQNRAFAFNVSIRNNKTAAQAVLLRHVWGGRWARTHDNRNHNPKMQLIKNQ